MGGRGRGSAQAIQRRTQRTRRHGDRRSRWRLTAPAAFIAALLLAALASIAIAAQGGRRHSHAPARLALSAHRGSTGAPSRSRRAAHRSRRITLCSTVLRRPSDEGVARNVEAYCRDMLGRALHTNARTRGRHTHARASRPLARVLVPSPAPASAHSAKSPHSGKPAAQQSCPETATTSGCVSHTLADLLPALAPVGTAQIEGTVRSATTSDPIEGIEVCAYDEAAFECTTSGASGEYDITGLAAGSYTVYFAVPFELNANYLTQYYDDKTRAEEATPVVLSSGATAAGVNAALLPGGQITGEVTSFATKVALDGIQVCAYERGGEGYGRCTQTNGSGEYDLLGLPTGEYTVEFEPPYESNLNYLRQYYDGKAEYDEAEPVAVTAGATKPNINAALHEGGQITGTVTNASTKAAVAKIEVCTVGGPEYRCVQTNGSGEYDLAGLPTGEYRVEFSPYFESKLNYLRQYYSNRTSFAEADPVLVKVGSVTPDVNAAMQPGGQISGTVTAAATKAALAEIQVCASENSGEYRYGCALTNASGEYTISSLPTGDYTVLFSSYIGPYAPQYYENTVSFTEAQPVSVTAGTLKSGINAAMQLGAEITGKVTGSDTKAALKNIEVCAVAANADVSTNCGSTDESGEYSLTRLPAAEYRIEFAPYYYEDNLNYLRQYYNDKMTSAEANLVSVSPGATKSEINAALLPGGEITGTVTDAATKAALSDIEVCADESTGEFFDRCAQTNSSGEYTVPGLPTGSYTVRFYSFDSEYAAQYYDDKTQEFEATPVPVTAGSTTPDINASLSHAAEITGTVTNAASKAPVGEVEVCALEASDGDYVQCTNTDASGEYRLAPLAAGEYKVAFAVSSSSTVNFTTQYWDDKTTLALAEVIDLASGGAATNINAELHEAGKITGKVTDASTTLAIEGIEVCARTAAGEYVGRCGSTNASGEYAVTSLNTGEYKLEFLGDGHNYLTQYYSGKTTFAEGALVPVTSGEATTGRNAAMQPGGEITGTVTGAVSKAPIGSISVCAFPKNGGNIGCADTNGGGEYSIVALPTAEYIVEFNGEGQNYIQQYYNDKATYGTANAVSVAAGSTHEDINAALEVGGKITGTVTTAKTKEPIADIEVEVLTTSGEFISSASTNASGEYTALALPTGEYRVVFYSFTDEYRTQYYDDTESEADATLVPVTSGGVVTPNINAALIIAPPVLISAPTISGADQEGHTLTEVHGSWKNKPTEYTYHWLRCNKEGGECSPIGGAEEQAYKPVFADVGHELRVEETAHNEGGASTPATSEATAPIAVAPPENTKLPSISGTAQQGKKLTDVAGTWTNEPTKATYQWLRCNTKGEGCAPISGAEEATYVPVAADVGHALRVEETAENGAGPSAPATSAQTAEVVPPIPVNTAVPTITGTAQQGKELTEHHGAWEYSPTEYKYQWLSCNKLGEGCLPIGGATEQTYTLGRLEVGGTIRVEETAKNAGGTSAYVMSVPTAEVLPAPPVNIAPPTIIGTAQQGKELAEHHGAWENELTGYKYEWLLCNKDGSECSPIGDATEQTYFPSESDVGHTLRVTEIAENKGGDSAPATSAPTAVVLPEVPMNKVPPTITGTARQGEELTEHHGTWHPEPTNYSYSWLRCNSKGASCETIGAAGQTYKPIAEDVGHTLRVEEVAYDEGGESLPSTSAATAVVLSAPPVDETVPTVTGIAQETQTLTVHHGAWSNEPTEYEHQWLRCNEAGEECVPITGATGETYTPAGEDVAHTLRVEEIAVNDGGPATTPVQSTATAIVLPLPPSNITLPTITGTAQQGTPLTAHAGGWEHTPTKAKLQWLQCDTLGTSCIAITGATGETYVPKGLDVGHTIRLEETAENAAGPGSPATSEPTAEVVASKPVDIAVPTISGTAQQGRALTEEHGSWTNEPTEYKYQWLHCEHEAAECEPISGATEPTYVPTATDVDHDLEVQEIAVNAGGESIPAISAPTAPVLVQTLAVVTPSLPGGTVGDHYSSLVQATGGHPPYTWSVASGSLPEGVSLNPGTGQLSGTPTSPGTASFSLQVTDSGIPPAAVSAPLSIAVAPSGPPTISSVIPNAGPLTGGINAVVFGTGFSNTPGASTFTFGGGGQASNVNCPTSTTCLLTVPSNSAGAVDVRAAVGGFTSEITAADKFTYSGLALTSVSPNAGPQAGGTAVELTGAGFSTTPGATTVKFGSQPAASVTCFSSTSCSAVAPPETPGGVDIRVTTGAETTPAETTDQYTFLSAPPEGIHVVFDPSPFAPPADLEPGESVTFSAIAEDADGTPVPNTTIFLAVNAPAGAGTFMAGSTVLTGTPAPFVTDATGKVVITYTAPPTKSTANPTVAASVTPTEAPSSWDAYFFTTPTEPTSSPPPPCTTLCEPIVVSCSQSALQEPESCNKSPTLPPWVEPLIKWVAQQALSQVSGCIAVPLDISALYTDSRMDATEVQQFEAELTADEQKAREEGDPNAMAVFPELAQDFPNLALALVETAEDISKAAPDFADCVELVLECADDPVCTTAAVLVAAGAVIAYLVPDLNIPAPPPTATSEPPTCSVPAAAVGSQLVFSPSPIAPPGSLSPGESKPVTLTVRGSNGEPVPEVTVYLAGELNGGTVKVGEEGDIGEGWQSFAASTGVLHMTYTAPTSPEPGGFSRIDATLCPPGGMTVHGEGFASSSPVKALLLDPFLLGSANANEEGKVSISFAAPPSFGNGPEEIELVGVNAKGEPLEEVVNTLGAQASTYGDDAVALNAATEAPAVGAVSPAQGPAAGGTHVTINGTNLADTTSVAFGSNVAAGFTVVGPDVLLADAPPGSGTVDITATTPGGESSKSAADHFKYLAPVPVNEVLPTITGTPQQGKELTEHHGKWSNGPTGYTYQWVQCDALGEGCLPISHATAQTYVPVAGDVGHTLRVEETAHNEAGPSEPAVSEPTPLITEPVPVNVTPPTIAGTAQKGETLAEQHGTWTNEPTGYAYEWLRCNKAGGECKAIEGAVDQTYLATATDVGQTLEVCETARNAGGASTPACSGHTSEVEPIPLHAVAGESVSATAGVPVNFDGSGSTPASEIEKYTWEFGDDSEAEGETVSHAYASPGTYTAKLTVTRGAESTSATETVTVAPAPSHTATVEVTDSGHNPLSGATVLYIGPGDDRIEAVTGGDGKASLALPDGSDTVYAYRGGFQPATGQVTVSGGEGETTIALSSGEIATSTLKSHEMTLKEIEEAGINTSDPENQNVYEFEVRLAFIETPERPSVELHCYINKAGEFVGGCTGGGGGGGGGGGWGGGGVGGGPSCSPHECVGTGIVAVPGIVEGKPLIQWLILRGKASVLKQFFAISEVVQNLSPEPFKLAAGTATLSVPPGLSLAPTATPQTATNAVPAIPGNGSAETTWIVRGDKPGEYFLSANYQSKLEPFEAPVELEARLATPLRVWGVEALSLKVQADEGFLAEGRPYHVHIGITNKANIPLYNVDVEIELNVHERFIFQPDQEAAHTISELKPGETVYAPEDILVPDAASEAPFNTALSSAHFVGEEIHPGVGIEAVKPPPLYSISAPTDTAHFVHLKWEAVPGAEGYEVFSTPNLDTPFAEAPTEVLAGGSGERVTRLPTTATEAFVPADSGEPAQYYAVTTIIKGVATLDHPVIPAAASSSESLYPAVQFDTSHVDCETQSGELTITVHDPSLPMNNLTLTGLATGTATFALAHRTGQDVVKVALDPADFSAEGATFTAQATDSAGTGPSSTIPGVCAPNGVLGFGDSVAAGYGLGLSTHYPDNTHSYPDVLGDDLGVQPENYAIEGACASSKEPNCHGQSKAVNRQLEQVPKGLNPSVITLTVGADDIKFADCFKAAFLHLDISLDGPTDPCNPQLLTDSLGALHEGLHEDLKTITERYKDAQVRVVDYYEPMPPEPSSGQTPCFLDQILEIPYSIVVSHTAPRLVAEELLFHRSQFDDEADILQGTLYNAAQRVVGELNNTLNETAEEFPGVVHVSVSFAGHDMCATGQEWAFAPTFQAEVRVLAAEGHITFGGAQVCPDPVAGSGDYNIRFNRKFTIKKLVVGEISINGGTNCLPHPTEVGQENIAQDILPTLSGVPPGALSKIAHAHVRRRRQ